jgi:hypothetical protein
MVFAKNGYCYCGYDCCGYDCDDGHDETHHCVTDCTEVVILIVTEWTVNVTSYIYVFY